METLISHLEVSLLNLRITHWHQISLEEDPKKKKFILAIWDSVIDLSLLVTIRNRNLNMAEPRVQPRQKKIRIIFQNDLTRTIVIQVEMNKTVQEHIQYFPLVETIKEEWRNLNSQTVWINRWLILVQRIQRIPKYTSNKWLIFNKTSKMGQ